MLWLDNNTLFASSSYDGTVRLWNPYAEQSIETLRVYSFGMSSHASKDIAGSLSWHPEASCLVTCFHSGHMQIWDLQSLLQVEKLLTSVSIDQAILLFEIVNQCKTVSRVPLLNSTHARLSQTWRTILNDKIEIVNPQYNFPKVSKAVKIGVITGIAIGLGCLACKYLFKKSSK
jgi:WD40 repeat protein